MSDDRKLFGYAGIDAKGKRISGKIHSLSLKEAQLELRKQGIEVIRLFPKRSFKWTLNKNRVTAKEIQLFTRYLSTMLNSGLPILQALDIIAHDQANPATKKLILAIKTEISGGKTLAETFSQYPQYFNDLYVSLIRAGEKSGTMDKILARLANYLEKIDALKRKIRKAMIYPIAVLAVALIVSGVLLLFVVPQFDAMFASFGAELPAFTKMIVRFSNGLRAYWWILLVILIGSYFAIRFYLQRNVRVKKRMDRWLLKIPVFGQLWRKGIIARFTRTLSTTLEAGMPIVESIKSMAPVMGNQVYNEAILKMSEDINSGHTLSAAMVSTKLFPDMVVQMVTVGEASGRLSEMLNKVADFYEEEVNGTVDNLSSLIEPLIMLILGIVVGGFIVAMYLPIFKIGSIF